MKIARHLRLLHTCSVLLAMSSSCRLGGPEDGRPIPSAKQTADAGARSDASSSGGHTSSAGTPGNAGTSSTNAGSANAGGANSGQAGSSNSAGGAGQAGSTNSGGAGGAEECKAPAAIEGCDPVCNTGCPTLQRCDIAEDAARGDCIGIWITGEGQSCARGPTTDSCGSSLTCRDGKCRRLCYSDSDCTTSGTCCSEVLTYGDKTAVWKLCAPCTP